MSITKALIGPAAVILVASSNVALAADYDVQIQQIVVSGVVESWMGGTAYSKNSEIGEDLDNHFTSGKSGRLSLPLGSNLSAQMDFDHELNVSDFDNGDKGDTFGYSYQGVFHLTHRDPNSAAFGGFAAFGSGAADNDTYPFFAVGGEAQIYSGDKTWYLQGGYLDSRDSADDGDSLRDAFFVRGVGRWFMTDNSRLQGEVAFAHGTVDGNDDGNLVEWGVRYDTMLDLPIVGSSNVFVGYRGARFEADDTDPDVYMDHTFMVGTRLSFGGNSMIEFDRVGASLDAPNFGRWVASGNIVD